MKFETQHCPPLDPCLSSKEAAKVLGWHPETLKRKRRQIASLNAIFFHFGGRGGGEWKVRQSALDAWIAEQQRLTAGTRIELEQT